MPTWTDLWTGETIGSALAKATEQYASRVAMVFENGKVTYQELEEKSGLVARGLLALGLGRGDLVAIWMAGYAEWSYLYYGAARIGAIMVPVNTRYKSFELEYVLNKSRARMLIFKDETEQGKKYLDLLGEVSPELREAAPGGLVSTRLPHLRHVMAVTERALPGCTSFVELLKGGAEVPIEELKHAEAQVRSEDPALIQFTSGTTAFPKGALLYHGGMLRGSYYNNHFLGITEKDHFFSPQPFYHVGGTIQVMLAPVTNGCITYVQTYFDPAGALRLMEKNRCTVTMGHQPHWIEYLNHPDLKKRKLNIERADIFAPPDVRKRVHEEMGIKFLNSPYGMSESHLGGCSCRPDDTADRWLNTVGRCMPGMEVGVRDNDTGRFLPAGETGELCFRGWCVMKCYYDEPAMTAEVIDKDGWLKTGDLGVIDPDGYVRLVGRIKDMIRVGGENVAAIDVESYLLRHEKVKQAMVVGIPEPRLGEVCVAFVELKSGSQASENEIVSYCRSGLAGFKVPRKVIFVSTWPLSGTGKIQKHLLKDMA